MATLIARSKRARNRNYEMSTFLDIAVIHFRGVGKEACNFFPMKKYQIESPILKIYT